MGDGTSTFSKEHAYNTSYMGNCCNRKKPSPCWWKSGLKVDVNTIAPHGFALLEGVTAKGPLEDERNALLFLQPSLN
jgi:hypothetical protein